MTQATLTHTLTGLLRAAINVDVLTSSMFLATAQNSITVKTFDPPLVVTISAP